MGASFQSPPAPDAPLDELLSAPREQLRDIAALLALPRMWRGRSPRLIAASLLDVMISLLRVELAYVRVASAAESEVFEDRRPSDSSFTPSTARGWPERDGAAGTVDSPIGAGPVRVFRVSPLLDDEHLTVIVGSSRADFPTAFESFLCRLAVEQAMIAINTSWLVARLQAANAAKATFLATMSHELRTPLNAIIGYSELLRAEIEGSLSEVHRQHVTRIDAAARHLLELIEGILNFARLEAGKERIILASVDADVLTRDVIALVEPLAVAKRLTLDAVVETPGLTLFTDAAKLRQILLNLLSNAIKFTSQGGATLIVRRENDEAVWIVRDTGAGISADDLGRIFEPFTQLGTIRSRRPPGTGLGLSVSRQLARLLGGDVNAESAVGHGSAFELRLPLLPPTGSTSAT